MWHLRILVEQLPAIEAQQQRARVSAALAPQQKPFALRSYLRRLDRLIDGPRSPVEPMEKIELNREKAKAWFEAQGFNVVTVESA